MDLATFPPQAFAQNSWKDNTLLMTQKCYKTRDRGTICVYKVVMFSTGQRNDFFLLLFPFFLLLLQKAEVLLKHLRLSRI